GDTFGRFRFPFRRSARVKPLDRYSLVPHCLQRKTRWGGRQRSDVRRVDVKVACSDDQVFRIRRFEDRDGTRTQYSKHLAEKCGDGSKRQMLDDMNRTGAGAGVRW